MATSKLDILVQVATRGTEKVKTLDQDLKRLDGTTGRNTTNFDKLAKVAVGVGAALGTVAVASKVAYDTLKQGAELELARDRFDSLTASIGSTADAMLGRLREATQGMASDAELIASANDIISLGLADTEDGVVRLANLVSQLGWDMQQVIMTFANNSKMRLDALGLSVEDVEEKAKALEEQGYSMDEAFDLAVIEAGEEKLQLLGSAAETSAGKLKQLEVGWNNFVDAVKLGVVEGAAEELDVTAEASQLAADGAAEMGRKLGQNLMPALLRSIPGLADLTFQFKAAAIAAGAQKEITERTAAAHERGWKAITGYGEAVDGAAYAVKRYADVSRDTIFDFSTIDPRADVSRSTITDLDAIASATRNYARDQEFAARAAEEEAEALEKLQEALREAREQVAATGDAFTWATQNLEEFDLSQYLYDAADAAGFGKDDLADYAVELGVLDEEAADAALKLAELQIAIGIANQKFQDGITGVAGWRVAVGQAVREFEGNISAGIAGDDAIGQQAAYWDEVDQGTQDWRESIDELQDPLSTASQQLEDIRTKTLNLPEGEVEIQVDPDGSAERKLDDIEARLLEWANGIDVPINPYIANGGEEGQTTSGGGGRAMGGSVFGGTPYIVGERGPELFVPSRSGTIVPNEQMGGSTYIINNYNRQAAAITRAMFQLRRATGIDRRMGVMA